MAAEAALFAPQNWPNRRMCGAETAEAERLLGQKWLGLLKIAETPSSRRAQST
jgi:hypothetical protein